MWWENANKTGKWAVGSCTPCPNVSACGPNLVKVPQSELDALPDKGLFSCTSCGLYNVSGVGSYIYPRLVDPDSADDNFGTVGRTAQLFLITNNCVSASLANGGATPECSPWDEQGLVHRDIIRVPIEFGNNTAVVK